MGNEHSTVVVNDETYDLGGHFKVHVKLYEGLTAGERNKLRSACLEWISAWQTHEFKTWLLNFRFGDTNYTNQEIYDKLLGGISGVNVVEKQADIEIWGKHDNDNDTTTITTTFTHDGQQWEGSPHLLEYSIAKIAGFLVYDYCRHQGFLHAGFYEETSIPFAVAKETKRLIEQASPAFIAQATSVKAYNEEEIGRQTD